MSDTSSEPISNTDEDLILPDIERKGFCAKIEINGGILHFYEVTDVPDQILIAIEGDGSDARILLPLNEAIYWDLMYSVDSKTPLKEVFRILSFWYGDSEYTKLQIQVTQYVSQNQQKANIPKKYAPEFVKSLYGIYSYELLALKLQKFKESEA